MDILLDLSNNYIRKVNIGKFAICEAIELIVFNDEHNNERNIYIKTMYNEYLNIKNKKIFKIFWV